MIFDHRTYTIKPNRLGRFLETYERLALPLQRKYLGEPYGFFVTHIGPMSRVVHLWQYDTWRIGNDAATRWEQIPTGKPIGGSRWKKTRLSIWKIRSLNLFRSSFRTERSAACSSCAFDEECPASNSIFVHEDVVVIEGTTTLPLKDQGTGGSRTGFVLGLRAVPRFRRAWLVTRFGQVLPRLSHIASMPRSGILPTRRRRRFSPEFPIAVVAMLVCFGGISDQIGRRATMLLGLGASLIGAVLFAVAPDIWWVFAGRDFMGVGVGLSAGL